VTLRPADTTPERIAVVQANLSELAGRPQFRQRALAQSDVTGVTLAAPHDIYTLGLDELANGAGLDQARPVAQRFLVMEHDDAIASAELGADGESFLSNEGPFVAATAAAIREAEADPELADGRYELRVLRIPGLYFMALWLKDEDGDGDAIVPLAPAPAPFKADRRYRPAELEDVLAALSRERLDFDDES
jgi:hypothetical protein